MGISIVILTFNKLSYTKKCIESIRKYSTNEEYELIVVDNCSTDGTREWLKAQKDIKSIFNKKNEGFPRGCNIGIRNSKKDNDIVLLNNDTIVTYNWLSNLKKCLYSDFDIGAVGPVTNSSTYYQTIETTYKTEEELHMFCKEYNKSDKEKWEERQKLIGFCMLIKRKALDKVGLLDEQFSPGNYEDDDISIRLVDAGYRLFLCRDTFIHHYGSVSFSENDKFSKLLRINENKFGKKWGFIPRENMNIYKNYEKLIKDKKPNILEIYCGTGATGLYIKQKIDCKYYGYDTNVNALSFVSKKIKIFTKKISLDNTLFDYIIISDFTKFIEDEVIKKHIASIVNYNTKIIFKLSQEEYSEEAIEKILNIVGCNYKITDGIREQNIFSEKLNRYYLIFQNKLKDKLLEQIKWIDSDNIDIKSLVEILKYDERSIRFLIQYIYKKSNNVIKDLNEFALLAFKNNIVCAGDIFVEAYNLDSSNIETLKNCSYFYYKIHEYDLALMYIGDIYKEDSEALELYNEINRLKKKENRIKYVLRRIEFNVCIDDSYKELDEIINDKSIDDDTVINIIESGIVNKIYIYNYMAIIFFEKGLYDRVIPYLNEAYKLDSKDLDTNYNLAYTLYQFGEAKMAYSYLIKLDKKNKQIDLLLNEIKEEMKNEQ